jgi:16S rRNA (adenine1518-N6/adenine1519-N6)-dimethyltransferase
MNTKNIKILPHTTFLRDSLDRRYTQKVVRGLLKKYNLRPSKRLGQNFLISQNVFKKIIKAACLSSKDIVLEIGPGVGNLTQKIAEKAGKLIAVEKDKKMCEILKETLKDFKNVKIIQEDILKFNLKPYVPNAIPYKIVANLPYYITAPVIRKFLETKNPSQLMILIVQKEVAQRICAKPPKMNLLAVSFQFYAKPEIISYVSKKSFWPCPKVDSAIIKITLKKTLKPVLVDTGLFFKIVRAGFSQPRKQILNNLSKTLKLDKAKVKLWLQKNKIQPLQRAETLSIKDWENLTKTYKK